MARRSQHRDRYSFKWALLSPAHWATWFGLILFFLFTLLPLGAVDWCALRLGKYAASKNKKRFNIARINLSLCFPDMSEAQIENMVVGNFQAQIRSVLHYFIIWWRPESWVRSMIETQGFEMIKHHQEQGNNVIILLTHNVGLEFACTAISMDHASAGPFKAMRNPVINWMIARGRLRFGTKLGGKLFTREDGLRPLIRETRAGSILIYLADEDLGEQHSIFAPFYGVPKATLPVLGRLAKSTDAIVLPCTSCYQPEKKKYLVKMLPVIEGLPSGDDLVDSSLMNQAIQSAIEVCPVQYLWTLRYFQTRPEGEAPVYE